MKPEYEVIINKVEGILQNYIGKNIAPGLEFNGFEVTLLTDPYPEFSTPICFKLIIDPVNDEFDDSDIKFEEVGGYEAKALWLDSLGLQDGTIMFV